MINTNLSLSDYKNTAVLSLGAIIAILIGVTYRGTPQVFTEFSNDNWILFILYFYFVISFLYNLCSYTYVRYLVLKYEREDF